MNQPVSLAGKRLLVTGAARGLGFEFARAAIAAGATVVIADILEERGRESATAIGARFVPLDLADPASVQRCADEAAGMLGGLDGLLNNGAIATGIGGKLMADIDAATWDRVMTVNVRGTWLMTVAATPFLKASGKGSVYTFSTITRAPNAMMEPSVPYCVGIVRLAEEVYLFTRFIVTPQGSEPAIDDPAQLEFRVLENGQKLPVFTVAGRPA